MAAMADDGCGLDDRLEQELRGATAVRGAQALQGPFPAVAVQRSVRQASSGLRESAVRESALQVSALQESGLQESALHQSVVRCHALHGPVTVVQDAPAPNALARQRTGLRGDAMQRDAIQRDAVRRHAALHRAVAARFREGVSAA